MIFIAILNYQRVTPNPLLHYHIQFCYIFLLTCPFWVVCRIFQTQIFRLVVHLILSPVPVNWSVIFSHVLTADESHPDYIYITIIIMIIIMMLIIMNIIMKIIIMTIIMIIIIMTIKNKNKNNVNNNDDLPIHHHFGGDQKIGITFLGRSNPFRPWRMALALRHWCAVQGTVEDGPNMVRLMGKTMP